MNKKITYTTEARSIIAFIRDLRAILTDFHQENYVVIDYIDFEAEEFGGITANSIAITVSEE